MPPPMRSSPEPTSRSVPVRVRWVLACCLGLAVAALAGEARPDLGAFPGANGLIAFQSFRDGSSQIYLETVPPSTVRRLTRGSHCYALPAWSPDGRRIAYEYNPSPTGTPARNSDIYVMNANGTGVRRLTRQIGFDGDPAWSPDGRKIVFESTRSGNADIWVMNADGTNPRQLTRSAVFDGDPAWAPGGSRIAFTSTRTGNREIYLMNPDGSGVLDITNNPANDFDPTWAPSAEWIAFVSDRDRNLEIYATNDRFLLKRLTQNSGVDAFPAYSPDGTQIAFTTDRGDAGNLDLHSMGKDGDILGVTELTQAPGRDQAPDWQPLRPSPGVNIPPARLPPSIPHRLPSSDGRPAVACSARG
jgi:Tol biopolymer transport system component